MHLQWEQVSQGAFGMSGECGRLGKIVVARAGWNLSRSRQESPDTQYIGEVLLPGFPGDATRVTKATLDEVKVALEAKVSAWLAAAALTAIE